MWLVAKNSSLLSPDLTLIILHTALRNLRVLGSIGPRTSIHIGKNSIEGRAFPYFFIFSSAALAAAKPHSLLVRFTYRLARVQGTVTSHAKHLPALQGPFYVPLLRGTLSGHIQMNSDLVLKKSL
ncbi:hypothetical protein HELRODRAFT_180182 [Helobdella robusta]|uniref:Uncharacterized protein n=1 Tax=Helobdella robusta TaxID=6412 RepID=T1FFJ8_HELRO|nr:hypothetical protein HELRODRAFT_180182 [Helobdella robusta]ESN94831.1 hypothetical protein HELRODRAFT_180182 [Helobdella robusta]